MAKYNAYLLNQLRKAREYFSSHSCLNPLIPESDLHLISPFNITPESNIKVMRIKEMITK